MTGTNDLTKGKASEVLLRFYFPMLFTNLLQQIYTFADTTIVGKGLGDNALAAVGNASSMWLLITGFSMGMTNGFSVVTAQRFGEKSTDGLRRAAAASVRLSVIISVILTILGTAFLNRIFIAVRTPDEIFADSLLYGYIIFGGVSVGVAFNLSSGILRAAGDSKTPFAAIMISSVFNIAADILLIFVFKTGVGGAAAATVAAQLVSSLICFGKIIRSGLMRLSDIKASREVRLETELLKNGLPMAFMNSVTAVGCMIVQYYINGLGTEYTSAYSVCSKYINLFMLPGITAGFSVSAFTGQNFGAREYGRIREGVKTGAVIAIASYLTLGPAMAAFPKALAGIMLSGERSLELAAGFLRICGFSFILLNLLFIYRNAVQGMGKPFIPMLSGFAEMGLRIIVIALCIPLIGFKAAAFAETVAWTGAFLLNFGAYRYFIGKCR